MSSTPSPRTSLEARGTSPEHTHTNGKTSPDDDDMDPLQRLERELAQTREEKETLAAQHRTLLSKLHTMRTTLGDKLKADAEELDRREQLLEQLTAQNDDLAATVETLKSELIASNEEAERASRELEALRARALADSAQEGFLRERELRETQAELERVRLERDEWEDKALRTHVEADEARTAAEALRRDLEIERGARARAETDRDAEREKSANLQEVLDDFQAGKDHDLKQAVKDYETRLLDVTQSLAEFKHRALTAEMALEETSASSSRVQELEKEVKERSILNGKLRQEAVIMNEHLKEALRRLRRSSTETNVDRRLVTNVLLSFLTTPRADSKRFEMLNLLSTILSWNDDEREKAGLQRSAPAPSNSVPSLALWGRTVSSSPVRKPAELDKTDETESFSRLWVEFLLTEATSGESMSQPTSPVRSPGSAPGTPSQPASRLSPNGLPGKRLASFSTLSNLPPPPRKGKERADS